MNQMVVIIGVAALLAIIVGPFVLGITGIVKTSRTPDESGVATRWNWKLTAASTLLYTLAFNLIFFIQELFLVVPKAFTPGLRPTLFHNNHGWEGEHALARLFQGTGAMATVLTAIICMLFLKHFRRTSTNAQLFLAWMAYCGFFMALPQVAIGALSSGSDLGMAMAYLDLGATGRTMAALLALVVIPFIALRLGRSLLGLADDDNRIATAGARTRFIFQVATLPALLAIPLIIPFRVPREWIEVALLPVLVSVIGVVWIQAGAWRIRAVCVGSAGVGLIAWPLAAVIFLLLVFQIVLRPGVDFY